MFVHILWGSVQFSRSVMSDSPRPHESQHARPPCPSPSPRVHSDSRPSSQWCHPAISSSVVPFSSCPQSLPASESFPMSQLFAWGGQSIGTSASTSVLPKNTQDCSPLGGAGWISPGISKEPWKFVVPAIRSHARSPAFPFSLTWSFLTVWYFHQNTFEYCFNESYFKWLGGFPKKTSINLGWMTLIN